MRTRSWIIGLLVVIASTLTAPGASAQLQPGDIAVIDVTAGGKGTLFLVNPITGIRKQLSNFADGAQGSVGTKPFSIALGSGNNLLVLDRNAGTNCLGFGGCGALFSVNATNGFRSLVSDFGDPAPGPLGVSPYGVTSSASGQVLVMDPFVGAIPNQDIGGALFAVSGGGTRSIVSDFTNANQGPLGSRPSGVALGPSGDALVADARLQVLFRVSSNGTRTIVTDFKNKNQGPAPGFPIPVTANLDINNKALVIDQLGGAGPAGFGSLYSVDLSTGVRTVVSDFTTTAQGPLGFNLFDVKLTADNEIMVVDLDGGTDSRGAVLTVDRATGQRDCVSDFGSSAQGPLGLEPSGLVIIPGVRPPGLSSVAALLPASRSVQVGQVATAFVTIINSGAQVAKAVGITIGCRLPITFSYQTTDPNTNALTGTINTPVDIPPGSNQTYVIAMTPTAAFSPTDLGFNFGGDNTARVAKLTGLNTLLLSSSNTPVPDIVALVATAGNNGIVDIPGPSGSGAFAAATVNVGAPGSITVSTSTGGVSLPVSIQLCQTDPATGLCISPIASTVSLPIAAGATPTFAVFVTGSGVVPFDPALNRITLLFIDAFGIVRGATSVAVRTL